MTRSPRGNLEILYLDNDLRITKGEKGTVLVCERQTKPGPYPNPSFTLR
jgi:hypothetical protein